MSEELVETINQKIDIEHLDEKQEKVLFSAIIAMIITFIYWLVNVCSSTP